ncbi:response regulator transcription factor [Ignavigranum ruoffiae]|uniref:Two-component system, OmpR family, response regulator protein BraR/BceR n=1 Tax=Ignavigranum ruoffiae TaxID=89093 RepID=A0A1H9CTA4_9LACT|nr:response regulator transcription factor [Ignavigranum ruoffiae]UPQ84982.1 response regulator transcription factor [Ignavigranum ruoffiae]SEQ03823.1 two-component system, OmpR family, response regulator protein BraR/BceR [Ignavigranum ruoffiae]
MRIYIVEDDPVIQERLEEALKKWHYQVEVSQDFNNILAEVQSFDPHLILLDIVLPVFNGYYWCEEIRKTSNIPIIFISSRAEKMDIVMAVQMGADDYITKPFDLEIVIAKIQALLRRTYDFGPDHGYLTWQALSLIPDQALLRYADQELVLSRTELMIMEALFVGQGAFVSRNKIIEKCWQSDDYIDDNTLSVNMTRLRKKLTSIGLDQLILTKKGLGYGLNSESGQING